MLNIIISVAIWFIVVGALAISLCKLFFIKPEHQGNEDI